jgi:hypothetical protein
MTAEAFVEALCTQGIELALTKANHLKVWPAKARPYLTHTEREYLRDHKAELKALVRAGLPETTVKWKPPTEVANAPTSQPAPTQPVCPYCGQTECDPQHPYYAVIHGRAKSEVEKRAAYQTAVMLKTMFRNPVPR